MEVINPFLQENKQCIIAFLDEMSASSLQIIVYTDSIMCFVLHSWMHLDSLPVLFYCLRLRSLNPKSHNYRAVAFPSRATHTLSRLCLVGPFWGHFSGVTPNSASPQE